MLDKEWKEIAEKTITSIIGKIDTINERTKKHTKDIMEIRMGFVAIKDKCKTIKDVIELEKEVKNGKTERNL